MDCWFLTKLKRQISEESIDFSINGIGIIGYPYANK